MPITRYTPKEKEEALRLCGEMGVAKTSRETGIAAASLRKWRADAQEKAEPPAANEPPPQNEAPLSNHLQTGYDESGAIVARLTKKHGKKAPQKIHFFSTPAETRPEEEASGELMCLRIENKMLKAQIVMLKGALRMFTE